MDTNAESIWGHVLAPDPIIQLPSTVVHMKNFQQATAQDAQESGCC